jgi:hypothetical protein
MPDDDGLGLPWCRRYFPDEVSAESCAQDLSDYMIRIRPSVEHDGLWLDEFGSPRPESLVREKRLRTGGRAIPPS